MSHLNFVIPQNKSELLRETDDHYYVRDVTGPKNIYSALQNAKQCLKDEGPEFIIDNFDVYYSVLHHSDVLQMDVIIKAYLDLHKAVQELQKNVSFLLEDKDSLAENGELKMKYVNILNMLIYVYTNITILIENKNELKKTTNLQNKGRGKKTGKIDDIIAEFNKRNIILALNNILQKEIVLFWDPPVAEEMFINMVAEVCYAFLENESIKHEKELRVELFSMLGTLLKSYNHGTTFVIRIVQFVKTYEHFVQCIPEGIQFLVDNFNAKSLVHNFVREITEWQIDEATQDNKGTRFCASVLSNMATLMPSLMLPEVMYLNRYLGYESYPLRNSVLNVITEVIIKVLNRPNLNEEEAEFREEFLYVLEEHLYDVCAHVRSKVYQHWMRLQKEMAVPMEKQNSVLEKATNALCDKSAIVRKNAANCITTFLSHNFYGHKLQMSYMRAQLEIKRCELRALRGNENDFGEEEAKQFWTENLDEIQKIIEETLKEPLKEVQVSDDNLPKVICEYIKDRRFADALHIVLKEGDKVEEWQNFKDDFDEDDKVNFYLFLMGRIFVNTCRTPLHLLTDEEFQLLKTLESSLNLYENGVRFLETIDKAMKPMVDLLESVTVGDMQEAVEFFITAYKFDIDNSIIGILEMLKIMQRNESDRRDIVTEALRKIYLQTDRENREEHSIIIVNRLINLLKMVPFENLDDLKSVISNWAEKNILDNTIIRTLWKYFAKEIDVTDDDSRAALYLVYMVACGRRSVILGNVKYVTNIAFGERGLNDLLLVTAACQLLTVYGRENQDITSNNLPSRIKYTDEIWKQLIDIFTTLFDRPVEFYNKAFSCAVEFIYHGCSKPDLICEGFVKDIVALMRNRIAESKDKSIDTFMIARLCHILGEIAIRQLNFLDDNVYKELKRRNYIRENKKNKKTSRKNNVCHTSATLASRSVNDSHNDSIYSQQGDDSTLEGAQAEDMDAEFILNVLENDTVTGGCLLGRFSCVIKTVCQNPNVYNDSCLQGVAVIALLRYMLVSSRFCAQNIQLIFTILERTKYPHVKCTILIHCSDLLERFPNIVEPWTPQLVLRLKDSDYDVRKSTFYMLANLSLKDMIRVHAYIADMALVIIDPDEKLREMSKTYFTMLSRKGNNLYNVLPDIFSHICENNTVTEENLQLIMRYLFGLIEKTKLMESLVDRFCIKFRMTEDEYICSNIAFCLTLITYNDKGAKRLLDQFDTYKHSLHFNNVYSSFKTILNDLNKQTNDVKAIATEIEEKINVVFEIDDGTPKDRPHVFKKPKGRARKKKQKKSAKTNYDDDDDDEDDE